MPRKSNSSASKKKSNTRKKTHKRKTYSNGCNYCGKSISGLPHHCRFCGEKHCGNHLLPENHKCPDIKKDSGWGTSHRTQSYRTRNHHEDKSHSSSSRHVRKTRHSRKHKLRLPRIRLPRIRLPRINLFFKSLFLALITFFLATQYPQQNILLWIEAGAWIYFSFIVYRGAFRWANNVSMGDDLAFFGLRILGGIITFVGVYLMFATMFAAMFVKGSAPTAIPIVSLIVGLILLGVFIAFRTNRRHRVVGIWGS